jgi:plastocyanin
LTAAVLQASARRVARVGACIALILYPSCDRVARPGADAGPRVIELAHDTIRLEAGERLIDVQIRREAAGDFEPAQVQAQQGDYVRFTTEDQAGHAIVFVTDGLTAEMRSFLERTGQLHSTPLIPVGATWVITLDGAPAGDYPFRCATHDGRGVLSVTVR